METTKQTSKDYFKTLTIVHMALVGGIVFFSFTMEFLILNGINSTEMSELSTTFLYVVSGFVAFGFIASYLIYRKRVRDLKDESELINKMTGYRSAFIVRLALLEGPAFFTIVIVFLTGNSLFLLFAGLIVGYMIYLRPTKEAVANDLELNPDDMSRIQHPDAIIAEILPRY